MLGNQQETILYRILSGKTILKINNSRLDVITPSLELLYESCEIYNDFVDKSGIISKEELKSVLLQKGFVKQEEIDFLKNSQVIIENFQKDLFIEFDDPQKSKAIRSYISATRKDQDRIYNLLSKYDTYTKEGLANYAKSIFLVTKTTYSGKKLYNFKKIKPIIILSNLSEVNISPSVIRQISKNAQWSNLWFGFKGVGIFSGANSSIEQQLLMMWSRMYESIKESPDCPKEEILMDDDATDGWLLLEKSKRLKEKSETDMEQKYGHKSKLSNAQEVFLMARNKKEADEIYARNSSYANSIRASRLRQIQNKGIINHQDLHDVRQEINMQIAKKEAEHDRGK